MVLGFLYESHERHFITLLLDPCRGDAKIDRRKPVWIDVNKSDIYSFQVSQYKKLIVYC